MYFIVTGILLVISVFYMFGLKDVVKEKEDELKESEN